MATHLDIVWLSVLPIMMITVWWLYCLDDDDDDDHDHDDDDDDDEEEGEEEGEDERGRKGDCWRWYCTAAVVVVPLHYRTPDLQSSTLQPVRSQNATTIVALATNTSVVVAKLPLDFVQTSSPDGNFPPTPNFEPWIYTVDAGCDAQKDDNKITMMTTSMYTLD